MENTPETKAIFGDIAEKWLMERWLIERSQYKRLRKVCKYLGEDDADVRGFLEKRGYDTSDDSLLYSAVCCFLYDFECDLRHQYCGVANQNFVSEKPDDMNVQEAFSFNTVSLRVCVKYPCFLWSQMPEVLAFEHPNDFILYYADQKHRLMLKKVLDDLNGIYSG